MAERQDLEGDDDGSGFFRGLGNAFALMIFLGVAGRLAWDGDYIGAIGWAACGVLFLNRPAREADDD